MKQILLSFVLVIFSGMLICADIPETREEVVYSITLFNGLHYSRTFCREESDTIYLLANTDNFLVVKKTLVFYWPLTRKYLTDTQKLNKVFEGMLEIEKNKELLRGLHTQLYIIYNDPGLYKNNWKVFTGDQAEAESARLEELMKHYEGEYKEYQTKYKIYETAKEKLIEKMKQYNDQGKDTTKLLNQYKSLTEPVPPLDPTPQELSVGKQFIINLPEGNYKIRFKNNQGLVLQGSEKNLVVFSERRKGIVGYRLVPGDRWTKPDKSHLPSHVLYVNPTTDIYIVPFLQNEYNDFFYRKMLDNDAKGANPTFFKWEEIKEIPLAHMEMRKGEVSISFEYEEYYAEKLKGSTSPGYKIVPYDPEGAHKDRSSSFTGFKIPLERSDISIFFKLQDMNGNYYPSSTREIRIVLKSNSYIFLVIFMFIPLIVMAVVLIWRQSRYRQGNGGPIKVGKV